MAIFRSYVDDLLDLVPTILRRRQDNVIRLAHWAGLQVLDLAAKALEEYIDSWPIDTASTWVLDDHWLPYHNLQRNGQDNVTVRRYIHAKRLLNKSWGAADQILEILAILLPGTATSFAYFAPKSWTVTIIGGDEAEVAGALRFLEKKPSPGGGGFSVAGDNGAAVVAFKTVFAYKSIHGVPPVAVTEVGWYGSIHGVVATASGFAHVGAI